MMMVVGNRFLPTALLRFVAEDWEAIKDGHSVIGWMHRKVRDTALDAVVAPVTESGPMDSVSDGILRMNEGWMSL
ncbi:MAG: hypothetical protein BWY82_00560 [Verrucomicrobia bacterium ADurb.Bin474]|nr:MAG: hypothetical protein BWY82_00560 [Verrucomicrobia bacterium ADurb.Bin474]